MAVEQVDGVAGPGGVAGGRGARVATDGATTSKEKKNRGQTQVRRGYRAEKMVEARLREFGFQRVPLSGRLGGRYSGDLRRESNSCLRVIEVKRRAGAQKQLRSWLAQGDADALVLVPGNGAEPLVVMRLEKLEQLLREAAGNGGA